MGLFGNSASNGGPPVQAVGQLRAQGRSDHDIIDDLSKQGYSSIDIYNALNQADQSQGAVAGAEQGQAYPNAQQPPQNAPDPNAYPQDQYSQQAQDPWQSSQGSASSAPDPWAQEPQAPQQPAQNEWAPQQDAPRIVHSAPSAPPQPSSPQQFAPPPQPTQEPQQDASVQPSFQGSRSSGSVFGGSDQSLDQIDQVAEAIIDEKWQQLKAYVEKIVDWKAKVEQRIVAIEQNQKMLDEQIVGLQKSLVEKVQTYDRHITDVGTEIKAMEKVFQKIIPSLTENVNELSSVVHRMKDEQ